MPESLTEMTHNVEDDDVDYLSSLVGDGKKYKDVTELARAYHNADLHIRELREDNDKLRTEGSSVDEVLEEIRKKKETEGQPPVNNASGNGLTKDDVAEVVQSTMTERERAAVQQANVNASLAKLDEIYGSREAALRAVRRATGGNEAVDRILDDLSRTDPDATVTFVKARVEPAANRSNTPGNDYGAGVRSGLPFPEWFVPWSKAREIKQKEPSVYNAPEFRKKLERCVTYMEDKGQDYFAT